MGVAMIERPAGWIISCHRRTGCPSVVWLPNRPSRRLEFSDVPNVCDAVRSLPAGWTANYWDLNHTRILRWDEQLLGARPHYFCSDTCRYIGCGSCTGECRKAGWCDDEVHREITACRAHERATEVSVETAEQIAAWITALHVEQARSVS